MVPLAAFLICCWERELMGFCPANVSFGVQVVDFRCNASWIGARLYQAGGLRIAKTATYP